MSDFAARRTMMVDTQVRPNDVTKFPVIEAMLAVPMEDFVPASRRAVAYTGENLDLGGGRVLLEPRTLGKMIDMLDMQPDGLVLDLGCGYGALATVVLVITVASMWGLAAPAGVFPRPADAASKGAGVNLTREMALHYADKGVQVNALCPGIFQTETRPRDPAAGMAYTPMGRLGRPEEIKGAVLYLASSASDFVTGTTLVIDGGVLAR